MVTIAILTLLACAGLIASLATLLRERTRRVTGLIQAMERAAGVAEPTPAESAGGSSLARLLAPLHRLLPDSLLERYEERLLWSGRPYDLDARQFAGVKLCAAVLPPAVLMALAFSNPTPASMAAIVLLVVIGFFVPDLWLNSLVTGRRRQVADELPLFTDLIATAVDAGLSLTEAVRRVAADGPGLLAREFLRSVQEMAAGKPRNLAWRDLLARLPGDDLRMIVTAIMQAEQYGTSVSDLLRYQVQQIRLAKQAEAQRLAQMATVKMRIPMLDMEVQPSLPSI